MEIRFRTGGWRGILGEDLTFPRARAVVRAVGECWAEAAPGSAVFVGHDTRYLADRFAAEAAGVLATCGLRPRLHRGPVATPVLARAVRRGRVAGGLLFTASHNPPEYQGLKLLARSGVSADRTLTEAVEKRAAELLRRGGVEAAPAPGGGVDLTPAYVRALVRVFEGNGTSPRHLAYDAFHGTGAGVLDRVLEALGWRVDGLRLEPDPYFGGGAPDPTGPRLAPLRRAVQRARSVRLGLATDGDADRLAVLDAQGCPLSEAECVALLVDHLARTGRVRRGVAITPATGSLVARVADFHGLPVVRAPMGFRSLAACLAAGEADVAGDECGGFAWAPFARDKDGILAGSLMAELASREPLRRRLAALEARHGRHAAGRTALPAGEKEVAALDRWLRSPPARIGRAPVLGVCRDDGLRLTLADGFLMLRSSGTEPLIRIYAEASGPRRLQRRIAAGKALLLGYPPS